MIESYFRNGHQEENGAWVHQIEPAFQEFKENFPNFSNLKHIIVNCCLFIYLLLLHYLFTHIARIYLLLWVHNAILTRRRRTVPLAGENGAARPRRQFQKCWRQRQAFPIIVTL
jgi:hypothetical protein